MWIRDLTHVYLPGKVESTFDRGGHGRVEVDGEVREVPPELSHTVLRMHKQSLESVPDMAYLRQMNDPAVLHNLRLRFHRDDIYTAIGDILISVNPFKVLKIFSGEVKDEQLANPQSAQPHLFQLAHRAFRGVVEGRSEQSCIISGESGAGKTEATKLLLQYLSDLARPAPESAKTIQSRILEANPFLEAFGNAKTQQNDNSSRFGKLLEVSFDGHGAISGGSITQYLLEKSRVVKQAEAERNYHIFYQLCAASRHDSRLGRLTNLVAAESYYYLNQSEQEPSTIIPGVDDLQGWYSTMEAMRVMGVTDELKSGVISVLSCILHLGNVTFTGGAENHNEDAARIKDMRGVKNAAALIGVAEKELEEVLLKKKIGLKLSVDSVFRAHNVPQAKSVRDTISQYLYGLLFDRLLRFVNESLQEMTLKSKATVKINLLDIFGFEVFVINSFEQLCINYCNEKLQASFNKQVFQQEMELLSKEGIELPKLKVVDNELTVSTLEHSKNGLFALLDEECRLPQGSDEHFLSKALELDAKAVRRPDLSIQRGSREGKLSFTVEHYAGPVDYFVENFLAKNRENSVISFNDVILKSRGSLPFLKTLLQEAERKHSKKVETVGTKFQTQLNALVLKLDATTPHYLRCIKPNMNKESGVFDAKLVLRQLRYCGIFDVCKIRGRGFPVRFPFADFLKRYQSLSGGKRAHTAEQLLKNLVAQKLATFSSAQVGKTMIFLTLQQASKLDYKRNEALGRGVVRIQAIIRGYLQRKRFAEWSAVLDRLQRGMQEEDAVELQSALDDASVFPFTRGFQRYVQAAREKLSELEDRARALERVTKAVQSAKRSELLSAVYFAEGLDVGSDKQVHMARQLSESMEEAGSAAETELRACMSLLQSQMESSRGVQQRDLKRLEQSMKVVKEEGDQGGILAPAGKVRGAVKRWLKARDKVEEALRSGRNMEAAVARAKKAGVETEALRQLESRIAHSESTTPRKVQMRTAARTEDERLSRVANMSDRFAMIRQNSDEIEGLMLEGFYKLRKQRRKIRLEAQQEPIKVSLTVLGRKLNRLAVNVNKAILQYCGDMPFPTLQRPAVALSILRRGLEIPLLCDEIYLQLCKHLSHNLRSTSESRAWTLMCLCTQLFLPSMGFYDFLQNFLVSKQSAPLLAGNSAKLCLVELDRTKELGPASHLPDIEVVATYSLRPAVLASIHVPSKGQLIDIPVYPRNDVDYVTKMACKYAGILKEDRYKFGVFLKKARATDNEALKERLINFYKAYDPERVKQVDYFTAIWDGREQELFELLTNQFGAEPIPQDDDEADKRRKRLHRAEEHFPYPAPWWMYPGDILLELASQGFQPYLTLRRRLLTKKERPSTELVRHLQQNIRFEELIITSKKEMVELAALYMVIRQRKTPATKRSVHSHLGHLLPPMWLREGKRGELADAIYKQAKLLQPPLPEKFFKICVKKVTYGV